MHTLKFTRITSIVFGVGLLLSACGGGGGDGGGNNDPPAGYSVDGMAYKGPLQGATIRIHVLAATGGNGDELGSGTTSSVGEFSISNLGDSSTGCIVAIATGGSYVDEATGLTVALGSTDSLGAAICNNNANVSNLTISPLSNAALSRARALVADGVALTTAVNSANDSASQQWGVFDVVATMPRDPLTEQTAGGSGVNDRIELLKELQYGLIITGISEVANDIGVSGIELASAIAEDAADGLLDGMRDGLPIEMDTLAGGTVNLTAAMEFADLAAKISALLALIPDANGLEDFFLPPDPIPLGNDGSSTVLVTTAAIPAFVDGSTGSFALSATGGDGSYTWSISSGTLPTGLSLSTAGVISGTPSLAPGTTMLVAGVQFTVQDGVGAGASIYLAVTVVSGPPSVMGEESPTGFVGLPFTTTYTATGGTPPYSYSLDSGTGFPPLGVTLNLDGTLAGTPSATGSSTFGVCAVDLVGTSDCMTVVMTVEEAPALAGTWSGTYSNTGPGDGGCTYQSAGILEFTISSTDGINFTGDSYVDGIMLRYIPSCDFAYYTFSYGTVSLTMSGDGNVEGLVSVYISETGKDYIMTLKGSVSGNTMSGEVYNAAGDTLRGSFSVTKQ